MDGTDLGTPITSSDWDEVDLGINQSTLNGNLDFLGTLDTNTNVTRLVTSGNDGLESGSLTGLGLLLNGEDAHDLINEFTLLVGNESLGNLSLLDWDRVSVNFFEGLDLAHLDESSELGKWSPSIFVSSSSETSWSSTSTSTATSAASVSEASASSSATSSSVSAGWGITGWCSTCSWCWGLSLSVHA